MQKSGCHQVLDRRTNTLKMDELEKDQILRKVLER